MVALSFCCDVVFWFVDEIVLIWFVHCSCLWFPLLFLFFLLLGSDPDLSEGGEEVNLAVMVDL